MRKKNLYVSKIRLVQTVFGLLLLLVLTALAGAAPARNLFVDAAAPADGDGTREHPFVRITDAVARARAIRRDSNAQIVIHVAPGTYVGSYTNTGPRIEPLPIRLDVPRLKLLGSTSMERDDSGWPTGVIEPGSNTLLLADPPLVGSQVLLLVASTRDEVIERVTIAKLSLDTRAAGQLPENLVFDQVQDFTIRDNYVTGGMAGIGIEVDRSSGQILGNYITRVGAGLVIDAGNACSPARVLVRGNRSVNNQEGGIILQGSSQTPSPEDSLSAVVSGNDLSDNNLRPNSSFGLRCFVITTDPPGPGGQTSGSVTATISNNRIRNNSFGVVMEAGFPYRTRNFIFDPRLYTGTFDLTFEDNAVVGSIQTPALITFTRSSAALDPNQLNPDGRPTSWKYLERSIFDITYSNGELGDYWFDHPETDPIDGRTLENVLRINGDEIPNGRYIPFP